MKQKIGLIVRLGIALSCSSTKSITKDRELFRFTQYLCGSFSSQEQAQSDTHFYDGQIEMVRIWRNEPTAICIYVEQAHADQKTKPYRQRVYRLTRISDSLFNSQVYEIPSPERFTGEWKYAHPLTALTPDSLIIRTGCALIIHSSGTGFYGQTPGKECLSQRKGATYAISEFSIDEKTFVTWERGFDAYDRQVWGSAHGGYRFKKLLSYPPE